MRKIAIAGASGFVGRSLIESLRHTQQVIALGRELPEEKSLSNEEWRKVDLFSVGSTVWALRGADIAIYLVHSMVPSSRLFQGSFHDTDLLLADNFASACRKNGVKQIIYLGGLVPEGAAISLHLKSRQEVEQVLRASGIPVTVFRAGMIVGPGGSSFEILRNLVNRLPVLVLPRWTESKTQVVFIDDVVRAISAAVTNANFSGRTFNLVDGEPLTYRRILEKTASVLGLRRLFLPVPIHTTFLSKFWVRLVSGFPKALVNPLIDSLLCDLPTTPPVRLVSELVEYRTFEAMLVETIRRSNAKIPRSHSHHAREPRTVRSIQRLPSLMHDARWIAKEYMVWLPRFFRTLLRVEVRAPVVEFRLAGLRSPLLKLRHVPEESEPSREKLRIEGGLLAKSFSTGWLEFRQIDNRKFTLVAIHEFAPRLPWLLYVFTQAKVHSLIMAAFGRHLKQLERGQSKPLSPRAWSVASVPFAHGAESEGQSQNEARNDHRGGRSAPQNVV
jgi:uncharacterized protein YbjT (DUF2867 family)